PRPGARRPGRRLRPRPRVGLDPGAGRRRPAAAADAAQAPRHHAPPRSDPRAGCLVRMSAVRPMKLAILGTRGVPASYGGFETFAQELAPRLVARGHDVSVYCRSQYVDPSRRDYEGVRLVHAPTIRHKYLDTVVHTAASTLHALTQRYDAVLFCNAANAIFCPWPRLVGTRVVLNVDGIERKRKKWNAFGRAWYLGSEWLSTWCPNAIVTDAEVMEAYYRERYGAASTFIP